MFIPTHQTIELIRPLVFQWSTNQHWPSDIHNSRKYQTYFSLNRTILVCEYRTPATINLARNRLGLEYETWTALFSIFDKNKSNIHDFSSMLHNWLLWEIENTEQLLFLYVLVMRNCTNELEFDIFKTDSSAHNCIPKNSHDSKRHKITNFNLLIQRLKKKRSSNKWVKVTQKTWLITQTDKKNLVLRSD